MKEARDIIRTKLNEAEYDEVFEIMEKSIDKAYLSDLEGFLRRYNGAKKDKDKGTLSVDNYEIKINQIMGSLRTTLVNKEEVNFKYLEEFGESQEVDKDESSGWNWRAVLLIGAIIAGLIYFFVDNNSSEQVLMAEEFGSKTDSVTLYIFSSSSGSPIIQPFPRQRIIDDNLYLEYFRPDSYEGYEEGIYLGGAKVESIEIGGRTAFGDKAFFTSLNRGGTKIRLSINRRLPYTEIKYNETYYAIKDKYHKDKMVLFISEIDENTLILDPFVELKLSP